MIQLRPYEPCDADTIISWIGDEVAFRKWCADRYETYPITADDMNRQYDAADHDRFFPMTAYDENGTAVTLYESTDGYWYDSEGTAYIRHSDTDFQVNEGNKHLTVY